jgi:glucan 1,3-beta-glucosidase
LNEFGFQFAGEWSLAINDCGQWINGMPAGSHYGGDFNSTRTTPVGDCGAFMNWRSFTPEFKTQMSQLTQFYMDMSRGSFFWSWKMGANSTGESQCCAPLFGPC